MTKICCDIVTKWYASESDMHISHALTFFLCTLWFSYRLRYLFWIYFSCDIEFQAVMPSIEHYESPGHERAIKHFIVNEMRAYDQVAPEQLQTPWLETVLKRIIKASLMCYLKMQWRWVWKFRDRKKQVLWRRFERLRDWKESEFDLVYFGGNAFELRFFMHILKHQN